MLDYKQNDELLSILKDKKVAVVGPSPHLMGSKLGKLIDSYDLVCRINEVHPTGYEEDYGSNTDIVFHNCGTAFIDTFGDRLLAKSIISKYLKFVVCPCVKGTGADNNWHLWPDDRISDVVANFQRINSFNIPFHWIGMENYRKIYNIYGIEPNAGQTSIMMLLEHQVKELLITGFSFYKQGDLPSLSHRPGHTNKGLENESIGNLGHQQDPQIRIFKNKILKEYGDRIVVDSFLNKLIDCNHHNVVSI